MSNNDEARRAKETININCEPRICDLCDGNDLEELWSYSYCCSTINNVFNWNVRNVACKNCGFIFVSPSPSKVLLEKYYKDSFTPIAVHRVDYLIDNRMHVIKKYLNKNNAKTYIEIGSNDCPQFIDQVSSIFKNVETIEINQSCKSKSQSIDSLTNIQNDGENIIASYFVLEHIPNPINFLLLCEKALSNNGYLILEVPNLYLYSKDISGLLTQEHVNHFSPNSLSMIAEKCGLELVETSHTYCSRNFGFVAVYKKSTCKRNIKKDYNPIEFIHAKSCIEDGVSIINGLKAKLEMVRQKINSLKKDETAIIWVANDICVMLLRDWNPPSSVTIIDSDPRKYRFLEPVKIFQPKDVVRKINAANLLVINSRTHSGDIQEWIRSNTGKTFREVVVLD